MRALGYPNAAVDYRKLSVIVPVYNERNTVAEVVERARSVDLPLDREIIVVDDGSTDGTREILPALAGLEGPRRAPSRPTGGRRPPSVPA